jgi:spore coat polysaccharide biosynthesis protein SpsF (cytidylyltransferase family)
MATTSSTGDDRVADLGESAGAIVVRGPEEDVLERFVLAQAAVEADVVVRLTGDCPMLDPRLVDRVVRALLKSGAEYAGNVTPPTYPDGYDVEALTAACLARLSREAIKNYEREHVTARAREHPEIYGQVAVRCRRDLSAIRLTVDTLADLERLDRILDHFPDGARPGLGAVLAVLSASPELLKGGGASRDEKYLAERRAEGA